GVLLPATQGLQDGRSILGRADFKELSPGGQLGLQPVEGLAAQFRLRGIALRRLVLSLPGRGQRRGAGGAQAEMLRAVVAELWTHCQCLGPETSGGGELLPVIGDLGDLEALGVVSGFFVLLNNGQISLRQGQKTVNPNAPLYAGLIVDQREYGLAVRA